MSSSWSSVCATIFGTTIQVAVFVTMVILPPILSLYWTVLPVSPSSDRLCVTNTSFIQSLPYIVGSPNECRANDSQQWNLDPWSATGSKYNTDGCMCLEYCVNGRCECPFQAFDIDGTFQSNHTYSSTNTSCRIWADTASPSSSNVIRYGTIIVGAIIVVLGARPFVPCRGSAAIATTPEVTLLSLVMVILPLIIMLDAYMGPWSQSRTLAGHLTVRYISQLFIECVLMVVFNAWITIICPYPARLHAFWIGTSIIARIVYGVYGIMADNLNVFMVFWTLHLWIDLVYICSSYLVIIFKFGAAMSPVASTALALRHETDPTAAAAIIAAAAARGVDPANAALDQPDHPLTKATLHFIHSIVASTCLFMFWVIFGMTWGRTTLDSQIVWDLVEVNCVWWWLLATWWGFKNHHIQELIRNGRQGIYFVTPTLAEITSVTHQLQVAREAARAAARVGDAPAGSSSSTPITELQEMSVPLTSDVGSDVGHSYGPVNNNTDLPIAIASPMIPTRHAPGSNNESSGLYAQII